MNLFHETREDVLVTTLSSSAAGVAVISGELWIWLVVIISVFLGYMARRAHSRELSKISEDGKVNFITPWVAAPAVAALTVGFLMEANLSLGMDIAIGVGAGYLGVELLKLASNAIVRKLNK